MPVPFLFHADPFFTTPVCFYFRNSSTFAAANTEVAQSVEHWSPKPGVGSSSLSFRAFLFNL